MKFSEAKNDIQAGGLWFKFKDGDNRVRIMSEPVPVWKAFNREEKTATVYVTEIEAKKNPNAKKRYAMWVLNRDAENKMQVLEVGASIIDQIGDLQLTTDYTFEVSPPYDLTIRKTGNGLETEYKVIPARQNTELTEDEKIVFMTCETVEQVLAKDAVDAVKV